MARARPAIGIVALAVATWLVAGHGLVNYDTLYALVWGRDLAHGHGPDYDVALAPTPHPLATLAGVVLSPLSSATVDGVHGQASTVLAVAFAFLALGALGWVVYRLGAAWFSPAVGVAAAAILLTRRPVLDFGARVYVDVPYLVLVLGALLVETRRPRAGTPVLVLLGLAGLIRPEAWLFSVAYLAWTRQWRLAPLALAAPVAWTLADLAVAGDALHSLTGTRDHAQILQRVTGLQNVPLTVPRRLGENLREPGLLAAAGGGLFALAGLRRTSRNSDQVDGVRLGAAAGVLSLAAFCVLAAAGLPILGRYLLLPAALLAVFAGAGLLGWRALPAGDPRRRPWQAFAALCALAFLVFGPGQITRIRDLRQALSTQASIQGDLAALVRRDALRCRPITVPNRRPIPLLALWLDVRPAAITSAQDRPPARGTYVVPATAEAAKDYILDPRDLDRRIPPPPPGARPVTQNDSWRALTTGCE